LGIAVAAWAAARKLALRPIIASGEIAPARTCADQIKRVGGLPQKRAAVESFLAARTDAQDWCVLLPQENFFLFSTTQEPVTISRLADVCRDQYLTDGFDEYRQKVARLAGDRTHPWAELSTGAATADANSVRHEHRAQETPSSAEATYGHEDLDNANKVAEEALSVLTSSQGGFRTVCVPFDADPRPFALHVARKISDQWWRKQPAERLFSLPVVLPMAWGDLTGEGDSDLFWSGLPTRLAQWCQRQYGVHYPDANAIDVALRRPRKLLLIVYDQPSSELWRRVVEPENSYDECASLVRQLAAGHGAYAPQMAWVICSDLHHQMKLDGEKSSFGPLALQAATDDELQLGIEEPLAARGDGQGEP
jgi:hypothetical protein